MSKFKFYFILFIVSVALFSCNKKDDPVNVEPLRDYQNQYYVEKEMIERYLNSNYINLDASSSDYLNIHPIDADQPSIMSYKNNPQPNAKLEVRKVNRNAVIYDLYYLVVDKGTPIKDDGGNVTRINSPCNTDNVLVSYKGTYLLNDSAGGVYSTLFQEILNPQSYIDITESSVVTGNQGVITGWGEVFPQFNAGNVIENTDGSSSYSGYGVGVMFLPSGLAYYNMGSANIPSYTPLVFSFKLFSINHLDHDNDTVQDWQENISGDGYAYDYRNTTLFPNKPTAEGGLYANDTDGDGIPNYLDGDDDQDGYYTDLEVKKPNGPNLTVDGPSLYYPFSPIKSNPVKYTDELLGIPGYINGDKREKFSFTDPARLRMHLDPTINPDYAKQKDLYK